MANNAWHLPEVLTLLAYFCLGGLGLYFLAHLIAYVSSLLHPRQRVWTRQSRLLTRRLDQLTGETRTAVQPLDSLESAPDTAARLAAVDRNLRAVGALGPETGLTGWARKRIPTLDSVFHAALEVAEAADRQVALSFADEALDDEFARWNVRLGLLIAAGPPAGAAPTMSGAMTFLREYAHQAEQGVAAPPMSAINDCLLTTYIGCAIAVLAIVLLAAVAGSYRRSRTPLREAVRRVLAGYDQWAAVTAAAEQRLRECKEACHARE